MTASPGRPFARLVPAVSPGISAAVSAAGADAPAVVFESGLAAPVDIWSTVLGQIDGQLDTLVYERPGVGRTPPRRGPRDLDTLAGEFDDMVLDHLGRRPVVVVAEGFGGLIAQRWARHREHRLAGLVLIDSLHPAALALSSRQRQGMARLETALLSTALRQAIPRGGSRVMPDGITTVAPGTIRTALRELRAWKRAAPVATRLDPLADGRGGAVPVALVASEHLLVGDPSHARLQNDLLRLSTRASLHRVPDTAVLTGHAGSRMIAEAIRAVASTSGNIGGATSAEKPAEAAAATGAAR
jgi:pimeloyl-ACP methyl ester carboxylesterase